MLDFVGRGPRTCDGVSRRAFLKVGALAVGGLSLPALLRQRAQAAPGTSTPRKSVILVWLAGGPSHIDMYDLKPNAPAEFRGEFKPIATNVPGIQVGEHLPRQARVMLGQCCLLARRLVEAGVTYVTVQAGGGWDTHADNFKQLKNNLLPKYDQALAALVSDLGDRGLDQDVLVMAMGEFGRTPRINGGAGRDHWPGAMSIVYVGGGLKMGQVIGTTNATAEHPTSKPATPGCVLATMYHALGIDYTHAFYDQAQRPLPILNEGEPIADLIG